MLKYVSIEVFLVFFVVGVILGGLIGIFIMCCLIAGRDSEVEDMNYLKKENNPCYGCTDRQSMCSIGCKRYKDFKENLRQQKEKMQAEKQAERDIAVYNIEKSQRFKRFKEQHRK